MPLKLLSGSERACFLSATSFSVRAGTSWLPAFRPVLSVQHFADEADASPMARIRLMAAVILDGSRAVRVVVVARDKSTSTPSVQAGIGYPLENEEVRTRKL